MLHRGEEDLVDITEEVVWMALKRMKKGRVPGIDEVCTEMIIAVGEVRVSWTKKLLNVCIREGSIPEDCGTGVIGLIWKGRAMFNIQGSTEALRS